MPKHAKKHRGRKGHCQSSSSSTATNVQSCEIQPKCPCPMKGACDAWHRCPIYTAMSNHSKALTYTAGAYILWKLFKRHQRKKAERRSLISACLGGWIADNCAPKEDDDLFTDDEDCSTTTTTTSDSEDECKE